MTTILSSGDMPVRDTQTTRGYIASNVPVLAAIEINKVSKSYPGKNLANSGVDLVARSGSIVGLLGRNGAGKTTLVRQITGELIPDSGSISLLGHDVVTDATAARRMMGVVPQDASPFDHLTVVEHLRLFARLRGLGRQASIRRADEIAQTMRLSDECQTLVRNLSGGNSRKLLVACAVLDSPPILVLDEPTTGLDVHARREVWNIVRTYREEGKTVLLTTHYLDEAAELCDRLAIMSRGRIHAVGTIEELRALCGNRYRAEYIGQDGERRTIYADAERLLLDELHRADVSEYSVGKTNLETLYLELTREELEDRA